MNSAVIFLISVSQCSESLSCYTASSVVSAFCSFMYNSGEENKAGFTEIRKEEKKALLEKQFFGLQFQ